jgi:NADP-dependent 3-hydroxy acid dehydrogenase YdfG
LKKTYNTIIAKKEIEETLSKIKINGGEVAYIAGDVNDLSGIKNELQAITQKWGQITGIVHGAGMLADKFIQNKTEADFNNVLSVKLDGLLSMLKVVNLNTLKHLVFMEM